MQKKYTFALLGLLLGFTVPAMAEDITYDDNSSLNSDNLHEMRGGNKSNAAEIGRLYKTNNLVINYTSAKDPLNVAGGVSYGKSADNNTVVIKKTSANGITYDVYGGFGVEGGGASLNSVTITGGTVRGYVYGGRADANANGNKVTISGGQVLGLNDFGAVTNVSVAGGYSNDGNATGNTVTISGGSIASGVYGGYVDMTSSGMANTNTVFMSGGSTKALVGGYSQRGDASYNTVTISGGTISEAVIGGYGGLTSTNNIINISGSPNLSGAYILGGNRDDVTGNFLNLYSPISAAGVSGFQSYNFYLPAGFAAGGTMITTANGDGLAIPSAINLSGTTVNIMSQGKFKLNPGDKIYLIKDSGAGVSGSAAGINTSGIIMQGLTSGAEYNLQVTSQELIATIAGQVHHSTHKGLATQLKSLSESRIASLGTINMGADLLEAKIIPQLRTHVPYKSGSVVFGGMGGNMMRYNSGSHVDVNGLNLLAGLGYRFSHAENDASLLVGAFFETGLGAYEAHNSFSAGSVDADGDTSYYGAGLLGRYDFIPMGPGNIHLDASLRAGKVKTNYDSSDFLTGSGDDVSFDSSAFYYGAHFALGYLWNISDATALDLYSRYTWTHQDSDSVTIEGDSIRFKEMNSQRWRTGARLNHAMFTDAGFAYTPYIGAAYEYEFDGKARGTANGEGIKAPKLKGDTGMGELGISFAAPNHPLTFDLGVQGYVGKREGVGGRLSAKYSF